MPTRKFGTGESRKLRIERRSDVGERGNCRTVREQDDSEQRLYTDDQPRSSCETGEKVP